MFGVKIHIYYFKINEVTAPLPSQKENNFLIKHKNTIRYSTIFLTVNQNVA